MTGFKISVAASRKHRPQGHLNITSMLSYLISIYQIFNVKNPQPFVSHSIHTSQIPAAGCQVITP